MSNGIVFCALARDCRSRLKRNRPTLDRWRKGFPQARWIFVENDSRDGTRTWLETWAGNDPLVAVIGDNTGEATIPKTTGSQVIPGYSLHRIERMARFRNLYLDRIAQDIGWDGLRSIVVIDPDVSALPCARVMEWLENPASNRAITAFGQRWKNAWEKEFHDAFAFRDIGDHSIQTLDAIMERRATLSEKIRRSDGIYPVRSNFNGLGIYPAQAVRHCRYSAPSNADAQVESDCEHLPFHDQLAANGVEIVLDPKLEITYNGWVAVSTGQLKKRIRRFLGKS